MSYNTVSQAILAWELSRPARRGRRVWTTGGVLEAGSDRAPRRGAIGQITKRAVALKLFGDRPPGPAFVGKPDPGTLRWSRPEFRSTAAPPRTGGPTPLAGQIAPGIRRAMKSPRWPLLEKPSAQDDARGAEVSPGVSTSSTIAMEVGTVQSGPRRPRSEPGSPTDGRAANVALLVLPLGSPAAIRRLLEVVNEVVGHAVGVASACGVFPEEEAGIVFG